MVAILEFAISGCGRNVLLEHLSIPSAQASSSRAQVFNFVVSLNAEEGTFVYLQSKGSRALESCGALSHTMCIQANDDVYEATRHRLTEVDEQQRKYRTQVISNEADFKRKLPGSLHSRPFPSVMRSSSQKLKPREQNPSLQHSRIVSNNHAQKPGNPELMRRPLRERLIHLLALKPYKKPELYDRLNRDGLSEKDRKNLPRLLPQVAKLGSDNTYHMVRGVWNDVQEDWPFYTEQDRQTLRRRKPQNLTPPGSSDTGSTGSGQSPTSTHPGSPPSIIQGAPKRPGYHETVDGIQSKRRRISHYCKPQVENYRPPQEPDYQQEEDVEDPPVPVRTRPYGDTGGYGFDERRNRRLEEEAMRKKEDRSYAAKNISDSKKSINITSDFNKRPNNYAVNDVKETGATYLSDNVKTIYDRKLEENVKRADSPATVTSSQQQIEAMRSKFDYADTRTKYQNSDTIQENTVSASDTVPDYIT
ncbi:hypothetical protein RUM43_000410 [Polyplax serrata]|uniref:RNA polymerase II elongation factor ELL N-terminal domain-containing protein n=1 Tax=Polyplax serrata TaxID=468196 RepID=A0AAN8SCD3_POLSC